MSSITYKDRRPETPHSVRMAVRRARQRARTSGFTPVLNARIAARITTMEALLTTGYQAQVDDPTHNREKLPAPEAIRHEAENAVARTLPQVPIGVRTKPFRSVSKYPRVEG